MTTRTQHGVAHAVADEQIKPKAIEASLQSSKDQTD
jgi:hypothetical protein